MRECSVRTPRSVRKLSQGAPVTPMACAHHARLSCSSDVAEMTAPPTTSLWPFRYLVVECMTMSAPSSSGRCHIGERKVLSTAVSARSLADRADIHHAQQRIARRLDPDQMRALLQSLRECGGVALVDEFD